MLLFHFQLYPYIFTWKNSEGASVPGPGGTNEPDTAPIKPKNYKLETILVFSVVGLGGFLTAGVVMGILVPLLKPKKKQLPDDDTGSVYSMQLSRSASLSSMRKERPEGESARTLLDKEPKLPSRFNADNYHPSKEQMENAPSVDISLDNLDEAATLQQGSETIV